VLLNDHESQVGAQRHPRGERFLRTLESKMRDTIPEDKEFGVEGVF
jgi:hypothetical protein